MTIHAFGALLCGAVLVLVTQTDLAQAQKTPPTPNVINLNSSRSNIYRMGGGGGKGTARATTVKSSKSNTSDRMGGGGGKALKKKKPKKHL